MGDDLRQRTISIGSAEDLLWKLCQQTGESRALLESLDKNVGLILETQRSHERRLTAAEGRLKRLTGMEQHVVQVRTVYRTIAIIAGIAATVAGLTFALLRLVLR